MILATSKPGLPKLSIGLAGDRQYIYPKEDRELELSKLTLMDSTKLSQHLTTGKDHETFIGCINMESSSAGYFATPRHLNSSSSRSSSNHPSTEDDGDNDNPQAILSDDPLYEDDPNKFSFKRKQKQPATSKFLSAFAKPDSGSQSRHNTPSPRGSTPSPGNGRTYPSNTTGSSPQHSPAPKDGGPLDWYVEGPGRRVGYEDMTAIDWIFEYTKERQRLRILYSSATGLVGYVQQLLDASQIWIVLILTGLAAGTFAAGIDIVTDFLADLKTGYCRAGEDGGHFYLNKFFCCYGYDSVAQCRDWVPWSVASNIGSVGGIWFIEYFFFILFSVGSTHNSYQMQLLTCSSYLLLLYQVFWCRNMLYMRSIVVSLRLKLY